MRHPGLFFLILLLFVAGCGDDDNPTGPGVDSPDRLVIVGPYQVLIADGEASYRAFAQYADGRPSIDVTDQVTWSSDDESVFTVDGGQIDIFKGGQVPIRAGLGDTEGKLKLNLVRGTPGIASPAISGIEHLPTIGQSAQLTATLNFPDGQPAADVTGDVLWESSDLAVLSVDIYGVVTAVGNGEAYITAYYGTTGSDQPIVAGPMPDKEYDVTVVAIRLNADQFCENTDEGDAEFSYEFSITTSAGTAYTLAATIDYPSPEDLDLMEDGEGTTGALSIVGEASFVLSEIQSFELTARVTEWDLTVYYFGDWFPDPEGDDITSRRIHRGTTEFDKGLHDLRVTGGTGCDMRFEYRIVVTER